MSHDAYTIFARNIASVTSIPVLLCETEQEMLFGRLNVVETEYNWGVSNKMKGRMWGATCNIDAVNMIKFQFQQFQRYFTT